MRTEEDRERSLRTLFAVEGVQHGACTWKQSPWSARAVTMECLSGRSNKRRRGSQGRARSMRTEEDRERSLMIKPDHCHSCQTAGRMALLESKEISEGLHLEVEELGLRGVLEPHGFPKAYVEL